MSEVEIQKMEDKIKEGEIRIIVNAQPVEVKTNIVTYEEVTEIAYPNPPQPGMIFDVEFRNALNPTEGALAPGESVEVKKDGTIFNVVASNKS